MCCPVQKGVQQIAQKKSRKKSPGINGRPKKTKNPIKDHKKQGCHDDARNRRHQKALLVSRKQMVRSVHDKMKSLNYLIFRDPVEQEPVEQIFSQGPEEKGSDKQDYEINNRDILDYNRIVN